MILANVRGDRAKAPFVLRLLVLGCLLMPVLPASARDDQLAAAARTTIERVGRFFAERLSLDGAYVWKYSEDLDVRKGEGTVGPTIGWVQPPGTPAVGAAFLRIYEATHDDYWLAAARKVADALVRTQLISGGWYNAIDMNASAPSEWCYRFAGATREGCDAIKGNEARNRTLLDDDTTQSALRFLIWFDATTHGKNKDVRQAILYGMTKLTAAQYPNGAWPVMLDKREPSDEIPPSGRATIPAQWPREWQKPGGGPYYILNDNILRDTVHLFLLAADHFNDRAYLATAVNGGEFLLKAQLPEPQQGWVQTYNSDMVPVWGRSFEPPAVASRETAGAISCLVELYQRTGDKRFIAAARNAAIWLRKARLRDGSWARYYELSTNRPLYVDNDENLTYSPNDLLDHYNLKSEFGIPAVLADLRDVGSNRPDPPYYWISVADDLSQSELESKVRDLVSATQDTGLWVEDGWIESQLFVDAAFSISRYLLEEAPGPVHPARGQMDN